MNVAMCSKKARIGGWSSSGNAVSLIALSINSIQLRIIAQALLRAFHVVFGIHGAKDRIIRNLAVKSVNQFFETIAAHVRVYFVFFHVYDANR